MLSIRASAPLRVQLLLFLELSQLPRKRRVRLLPSAEGCRSTRQRIRSVVAQVAQAGENHRPHGPDPIVPSSNQQLIERVGEIVRIGDGLRTLDIHGECGQFASNPHPA